jgi:hypothetical protein
LGQKLGLKIEKKLKRPFNSWILAGTYFRYPARVPARSPCPNSCLCSFPNSCPFAPAKKSCPNTCPSSCLNSCPHSCPLFFSARLLNKICFSLLHTLDMFFKKKIPLIFWGLEVGSKIRNA